MPKFFNRAFLFNIQETIRKWPKKYSEETVPISVGIWNKKCNTLYSILSKAHREVVVPSRVCLEIFSSTLCTKPKKFSNPLHKPKRTNNYHHIKLSCDLFERCPLASLNSNHSMKTHNNTVSADDTIINVSFHPGNELETIMSSNDS